MSYDELIKLNLNDKQLIKVKYIDADYCFVSTFKWCKNVYTSNFCNNQGIVFEV